MHLKPNRLPLFPDTTTIQDDALRVGGFDLNALAEHYGTPLYVYDRATMDQVVRQYKASLKEHYPASASITYAGKAFFCKAMAEWAGQRDLQVDCTGEGELAMAVTGRLSPSSIIAHGVNKSRADLAAAMTHAGTIVVDHLGELRLMAEMLHGSTRLTGLRAPTIWLRLQPGEATRTQHPHTQTGQRDSKFGMTIEEMLDGAAFARSAGIAVDGIHFHQGSNFRDTAPLVSAIQTAVQLAKDMGLPPAWHLCPGGGWGAAYHEDELPQPDIDQYVRVIAREVIRDCRTAGLPLPTLHLEPGRSLVARAGIAIYRVGAVKRRKHRTWLLVDGGMADNPRHALYAARYSCLPTKGLGREMMEMVSIAGPYCESGDVLIEDIALPPLEEGELVAIPVSGAYQLSMASNYNGARRPAAVWLEKGKCRLILSRETTEDLTQHQLSIM